MNSLLKFTGARQGLDVSATFSASKDFFASIGSDPALNFESFLTNLLSDEESEE